MPRKSEDGRFIISAGEVGVYAVCPESWRLKTLARVAPEENKSFSQGIRLHQSWSRSYDISRDLARGIRLVAILVLFAIFTYLLSVS